jgi:hypothetical protein
MIDTQLARQASEPSPRPRPPRPVRQPWDRLPAEIATRWDDLVCVVGEANAWPYRDAPDHQPDELIHWVAHRPATGATFEALAAPRGALAPSTPFHTRLTADAITTAPPLGALLDGYAAFTRPTDLVCAWGHHGAQLLCAAGGALPVPVLDLRVAVQRALHQKFGSLEAFAATLGPTPAPLGAGRAGQRVALLTQLVSAWRAVFPR